MPTFTDTKDPDSVVKHTIDWSAELALTSPNDTILTSTWYPDAGITLSGGTNSTTSTSIIMSGGYVGRYANITNRITTNGGFTYDATIVVDVIEK